MKALVPALFAFALAASAAAPRTFTAEEFKQAQAQSKPVLIDFWATWCGPCRTQGPIVEEVAAAMGDRAIVAKVDVDKQPELAKPFKFDAIPTLIILKNGKEVARFTGVTSKDTLLAALKKAAN